MIYSSAQLYDAEIVKNLMEENDIECVLMNKQDSAYMFGDIEIYVPTSEAFRAKQVILNLKGE